MSESPPASVIAMGAVTPIGRELRDITTRLLEPAEFPDNVRRVSDDLLADPALARHLRRADRYIKMAATAAADAWNQARARDAEIPTNRIGMIVSSAFGPHGRGFRFLDGLLANGDDAASPTDFSHSVHGAASAYISGMFDIRGPSLNCTDFEFGFEQAVQVAQCWLAEGACDRVLIGAVEELGDVMLYCGNRIAKDSHKIILPGEGAVFLMLAPRNVPGIAGLSASADPIIADWQFVEDPPLQGFGISPSPGAVGWARPTVFEDVVGRAHPTQAERGPDEATMLTVTKHFGHCASSAAFETFAGLLSILTALPMGRIISPPLVVACTAVDSVATHRRFSGPNSCGLLIKRNR